MSYPHWGREDVIADLIEEAVSTDAGLLIEVVAPSGAGGSRFVDAIARGVEHHGRSVQRIEADQPSPLHPGSSTSEVAAGAATLLVLEHAHLAASRSLAIVATRLVTDDELTVVVEREPLDDIDVRPFRQLAEIARQSGGHRLVELTAPTVDDVASALDLERAAALALHKAAGGRDERLVGLLDDLGSADGEPRDLAGVLSDMTEQSAPLHGLNAQAQHIAELTSVAIEPLGTDVVAAATGMAEREVLEAVEALVDAGIVHDSPNGISAAATRSARAVADSLGHARARAAHRAVAEALADRPGHEQAAAHHFERAAGWQQAFDRWAALADSARGADSALADVAVERALLALAQGATTEAERHGRLLLARAQALRDAAYSDLALDDFRAAVGLLTGEERIDALGFLAAGLDDQQLPQEAEVTIAIAEWEAHTQGAIHKLGSLLTFRARTAARLGFADEADRVLEQGVELITRHGTPRQQRNARANRAWLAFDRGEASRAEQLFDELLADSGAGPEALNERAWHGRALALRGLADRACEEFDRVDEHGDDPSATAAQFLTAIGRQELAVRFARPEDALAANRIERALVTLFLPAWENGTWHRRAEALLAAGDLDGAAQAGARAMETTPSGANGRRWRLRTEALVMKIEHHRSGAWDKAGGENLTDELLHSGWYGAAADLMVTRATVDGDAELADEAADLALRLGDPIVAAAALAAGATASRDAVARAVQAVADDVPDDWAAAWEAQPGIAEALTIEVHDDAAEPDWHADLRSWLDEVDLAERRLSPAQRRAGGLVRRSPEPRRWGLTLLASTIAAAVVATLVVFLVNPPGSPTTTTIVTTTPTSVLVTEASTTTTLPPVEDRFIEAPATLAGEYAYRGGNTRSGVVAADGVTELLGYHYRDDTANPVRSSPAIRGNNAYVGAEDGDVHIIDLVSGIELTVAMSAEIVAPVVVAEIELGGVATANKQAITYAADRRGLVLALNQDTSELGRVDLDADITAAPLVSDEGVVVFTGSGRIVAYRHDLSGDPLWEFMAPEGLTGPSGFEYTAAAADGLLYAADDSGVLFAVDLATGEEVCRFDTRVRASAGPSVAEGRVWVPAGTAIHVLEERTCRPPSSGQIQVQIGAPALVTPVIVGDTMYVAANRILVALDLAATGVGGEIWAADTDGLIRSSPVYANGTLYFGSDDGRVYAVDAESGDVIWTYDTGGPVQSSVAVIDGVVVATNNDGLIVAIAGTP